MALWNNGGSSYPDVIYTIILLVCALTGTPLNLLSLRRNYKKPTSIARTLYLLLQMADLGTCIFICPSVAFTISTPKSEQCFEDEKDSSLPLFVNCTTNYISYAYYHPSTLERSWSVFCYILAYSPCILTGMLALTRFYQIKYPFRHVSKRLVVSVTVAGAIWAPLCYAEKIRRKGSDIQAKYVIAVQQVMTGIAPSYDLFGLQMPLVSVVLFINSVQFMFQGSALLASMATIVLLLKLRKQTCPGSKIRRTRGSVKILISNVGSLLTQLSFFNLGLCAKFVQSMPENPGERIEFDYGGRYRWYCILSSQLYGFILPIFCSIFNPLVFLIISS